MAALDPTDSDIRGLQLSLSPDGTTITTSPGVFFLAGTWRVAYDGTATVSLPATPLNNTFYHVYGYAGPSGMGLLELDPTVPAAPYLGTARTKTGDGTRRYLGTCRTESAGKFRSGRHIISAQGGNLVKLDRASAAVSAPARPLNLSIVILTQPALQTVSLAAVLPLTATMVRLKVRNASNLTLYFSRPSLGAPTAALNTEYVDANMTSTIELILDSDLTFTMQGLATNILGGIVTIAAGQVTVEVTAYYFNR
jgi:hypothetical protein